MIAPVAALAETMHLCAAMGLDQQQFVALLEGGPLGSAYGLDKLREMRSHEYPPGFPVRLALKDLGLVREVAESQQARMPLLERRSSSSLPRSDSMRMRTSPPCTRSLPWLAPGRGR